MTRRLHNDCPASPLGRLHRLDGLRGLLAVYVMLGHIAPFIPWPPLLGRIVEALVSHGLAGVDLFFALSGLVIVQSMSRFEGRVTAFLAARARRLLPVYFVVLIFAIVVLAGPSPFAVMPWLHPGDPAHQIWQAGLPRPLWVHVAVHATLLQGMIPQGLLPDAEFALLGPAWSLSTEWQFYVVIAVLMAWAGGDRRGLTRLTLLGLAVAVVSRCYAGLAPFGWQFPRAFLPNEAAYFAIGIAAARMWRGGGVGLMGMSVVIAMLLGASHASGLAMLGKALPPLIWVIAIAAQRTPRFSLVRPVAWVLDHPAMLWLGAISYPLYLVNEPVGRGLAVVIGRMTASDPVMFSLLWGPLTLAMSIGAAAILHYAIETRFMRRRMASVSLPAAAPGAGSSSSGRVAG
jgi:Predicted acyltransferases